MRVYRQIKENYMPVKGKSKGNGITESYGTKLLLHCNGENGSTVFKDECGHTTKAIGNAVITTNNGKFTTSSANIPENTGFNSGIEVSESSDFIFGTDAWSFDCWVYTKFRSTNIGGNLIMFNPPTGLAFFEISTGTSFISIVYRDNTGARFGYITSTGETGEDSRWTHIAVIFSGLQTGKTPRLQVFVNGKKCTLRLTNTSEKYEGNNFPNFGVPMVIGKGRSSLIPSFYGFIDEVRIVRGYETWVENFDPPRAEYRRLPL